MSKKEIPSQTKCPVCDGEAANVFFEMRDVPTLVNFLHPTQRAAVNCPRGDIILTICPDCQLIRNIAFDPKNLEYGEEYENSLYFSEVFKEYASTLADDLIARFELRNKAIIEIGCGSGEFLDLLCDRGPNRGIGFDPSYAGPPSGRTESDRVEIIRDFYSESHADFDAEFICCRHTLEHVSDPKGLLATLRRSLGGRKGIPIFFEVPNASYTLENLFIWDIIYEHVSYFTARSLKTVFEKAGFEVIRTYETFSGQYLCIECVPGGEWEAQGSDLENGYATEIGAFRDAYRAYIANWRANLAALRERGQRAIVWGAGSKGVTFLNTFEIEDVIASVIDLNPKKHGMFVAGAGVRIESPEAVSRIHPDAVIVANPVYSKEIEAAVRDMGENPDFLVL